MYFDDKLTESMQDWLNREPAQRDFAKGAEMMLKFNHNKILYHNAMRRPDKMMDKVEYELRKYLRMQLDRVTTEQVMVMDKQIIPAAAKTIADNAPVEDDTDDDEDLPHKIAKGMREDHDKLPAEIQKLWVDNGEIYFKIKELFNTLKTMEKAQPCDRYEYLVQLKELDTKYHKNLEDYDAYVITAADAKDMQAKTQAVQENPAELFKKASAARTYISENKKKLETLNQKRVEFAGDEMSLKDIDNEYAKVLAKVQKRYNWLVDNGLTVSEEQLEALKALGLIVV